MGAKLRDYMEAVNAQLEAIFSSRMQGFEAREDSRAFGAMIQRIISDNWVELCRKINAEPASESGKRTLYDFANVHDSTYFGFDLKTKDIDTNRYSDGGVCAVGNLLNFLVNERAVFVVVEFGHRKSKMNNAARELDYIRTAPLHLLPGDSYRIENLGTGQIRLNSSINQMYDEIQWNRSMMDFLDIFVDMAIKHYEKVGRNAQMRKNAMVKFKEKGYEHFSF